MRLSAQTGTDACAKRSPRPRLANSIRAEASYRQARRRLSGSGKALPAAHRRHHQLARGGRRGGRSRDSRGIANPCPRRSALRSSRRLSHVTAMPSRRQARIGLHERLLDLVGRHRQRRLRLEIVLAGSSPPRAPCARFRNRPRGGEARAGAVLVPFVEDQPRRRHQVEHRRDDVAVEPRRRLLAIFRKAVFVLRPQAVHDEGIGPRAALLLRRSCPRSPAASQNDGDQDSAST